mmetsp:Transcript_137831/g.239555  ORF Transcript_137831/g.239555 Transcript_137831/m.239555 type:complete len:139 (-) Transcript_137831:121-537(-)
MRGFAMASILVFNAFAVAALELTSKEDQSTRAATTKELASSSLIRTAVGISAGGKVLKQMRAAPIDKTYGGSSPSDGKTDVVVQPKQAVGETKAAKTGEESSTTIMVLLIVIPIGIMILMSATIGLLWWYFKFYKGQR